MQTPKILIAVLLSGCAILANAQNSRNVAHFNKIIVSPYIQVTLVEGDEESVAINELHTDNSKLHIEVNDQTLRIYLEGAKDIPKYEKDYSAFDRACAISLFSHGKSRAHPHPRPACIAGTAGLQRQMRHLPRPCP